MVGRTVAKHGRIYIGGLDYSGYMRQIGEMDWSFGEAEDKALSNALIGHVASKVMVRPGPMSVAFDNTASVGPHVNLTTLTMYDLMVPIGIQAAPAQGDPVWCSQSELTKYKANIDDENLVARADLAWAPSVLADHLQYEIPWGWLLHAKGAETGANSAVGIDDYGASSAFGGFMMYQVFAGNGTATIKVQDASTNSDGSFGDLVSSGEINFSGGESGVVALSRTATVDRYLRWQLALNTATSVNFALAFVRAFT